MKILAIESSCDETAASLLEISETGSRSLITNIVSSQMAIHAQYGGVVPEVAARNHVQNILPVIEQALGDALPDCIAVTAGPGLITSLLVGVEVARTLSYLWDIPLVAVNHLEGHIYANLLESGPIEFPALVLIVSGGHTELVFMSREGQYELVGQTVDDAAGEAFDKVAKMLDLGYPGGPTVGKRALEGNPKAFHFPRPMLDHPGNDFSFSGLKTSVRYANRDWELAHPDASSEVRVLMVNDVCASFQAAAVEVLVKKTLRAARHHGVKTLLFGGGVMANHALRAELSDEISKAMPEVRFHLPSLAVCTDNAAMIASAAYIHAVRQQFTSWDEIDVRANWNFHSQ